MTNPDNVGGLPELPAMPDFLGMSVREVELACANYARAYGELCRAAPAGGDDYEARYATPERLAKPAATVKCDFCGVRPGELHAYDCTALDSAPAGSGEVHPIPQELFDRAHRLRELAAANRLNECLPTIETMCGKNAGDAIRDAAALLRKLQQGAHTGEVVAHRLHTPGGKWQWIDGEPSLGTLDLWKSYGWKLEYAYSGPDHAAIAAQRKEGE